MAKTGTKLIADNRRARFDYDLLERFEAGLVLHGTEVKSLRDGKLNLGDSYCVIERDGQVYLKDAHISAYSHGTHANHEPLRTRKLLLNRGEIRRLDQRVREKGLTLIPTRVYLKYGWVKVEIALAKGRKKYDKREQIKERDVARDTQRHLA
jgi:SsrA-binding protein